MIRKLTRFLPHEFRQRMKRSLMAYQDMTSRLANLRRAGFTATGAVDGGAYHGDWTRLCWSIWPACPVAMVEPLPAERPLLEGLATTVPGSFVVPRALGRVRGEVLFRPDETNSAIVTGGSSGDAITVPCTTLDDLLNEAPGFSPNLLKLDLQGAEMEALDGASRHLPQFEVIVLEASLIRIGDVPVFAEIQHYMEKRDYRLYDVLPQYYRPLDGALWQVDVFYARRDSPLVSSRNWD